MIGYWNYTTLLTYISVLLATLGIGLCICNPNMGSNIDAVDCSIICLLLCGFFDMFDGKVARTKKDRTEIEKDNGIQIDSLSDLVAFGILPAAIAINIFNYRGDMNKWYCAFIIIILLAYVLFGLVRLGFFNALEHERTKTETGKLKYFTGMPITMASFFIPIFYLFKFIVDIDIFKWIYLGAVGILGLLFVLKIKIPKADKKMVIGFIIFGVVFLATFILLLCLK